MKRKMIALLAGVLLTLGASNAMAYFEDYQLVRVVYNTSTHNETVTDLGTVQSLIVSANNTGSITVGGGADAFTGYAGTGSSASANLMVAYFAINTGSTGTTDLWLSSPLNASLSPANGNLANLQGGMVSTFMFGYSSEGTSTVSSTNANASAYQNTLSPEGSGNFGAFLGAGNGEASLATIATASIVQGLYYWADGNVGNGTAVGNQLQILTNANGSTTITAVPNQVPIPAAAWLLGSGLMGLVGIRRKQNK